MRIKLKHLLVAGLISSICAFSSTSNTFSASQSLKKGLFKKGGISTRVTPHRKSPKQTIVIPDRQNPQPTIAIPDRQNPQPTIAIPHRKSPKQTIVIPDRQGPQETIVGNVRPHSLGPDFAIVIPDSQNPWQSIVGNICPHSLGPDFAIVTPHRAYPQRTYGQSPWAAIASRTGISTRVIPHKQGHREHIVGNTRPHSLGPDFAIVTPHRASPRGAYRR